MTVAELIAALQKLPQGLEVVTNQTSEIDGEQYAGTIEAAVVAWADWSGHSWSHGTKGDRQVVRID